MKVSELIAELQKLPPDTVVCWIYPNIDECGTNETREVESVKASDIQDWYFTSAEHYGKKAMIVTIG